MQIHFSQCLKFSDTKKELLSSLVSERINLLIGTRKGSYIENVFFVEDLKNAAFAPHEITDLDYEFQYARLCVKNKKADVYLSNETLYSLLYQTANSPIFDDTMFAISRNLSAHTS